jgi:hypothetical protein
MPLVLAGVTGMALITNAAVAAPITLLAEQTQAAQPSSFTLNFEGFGEPRSAQISQTQFDLELDPDLGTARFTRYTQQIGSITLPGDIPTGDITVTLSSVVSDGTFNDLDGEFGTGEEYRIEFDGDLSLYGFAPGVPVVLPSASVGAISLSAAEGGQVTLRWEGVYELDSPFGPIMLRYTCDVAAAFALDALSLVRLSLIPQVTNLELPTRLESNLLTSLDAALEYINAEQNPAAVGELKAFIRTVQRQRGIALTDEQADALVADARAAIDKLGGDGAPTITTARAFFSGKR